MRFGGRRGRAMMLLMLVAVLLAACPGSAAEYHVATTGDDANAGSEEAPFRTLKKGMSVLKPGDTLNVKNGTYKGVIDYGAFPSGESWEKPVRVAAQAGHRPVIVPPAEGEACFYIVGARYLVFDGFVLDSAPKGQGVGITWGTGFPQASYIELRNCEIKNSKGQGILTGGDGCRFINLDVHDNGSDDLTHGIYLNGDGNVIDGGRYYRNVGWGIHVYPKATNTVVRNTRCYENGATGLGLVWGSNNVAYNNIVYGNGSGIHLSGDSPRAHNNTVYGNKGEGVSVANDDNGPNGTKNAEVRNNIAYRNGDGDIKDHAKGAGTKLANNFTGDPKFVDAAGGDFRLREDSPAIDAGEDLRSAGVTADREGAPRPQGKGFDLGAYERVARRQPARGPLKVHPDNGRYFTDGVAGPEGRPRVVYLAGSHTWDNLQDSRRSDEPGKAFDYSAYLQLMRSRGHNFMRLWAWERGVNRHRYEPLPYVRTESGKFDLSKFDESYFGRLRTRVMAARDEGIYVSVMLFQGWSIYSHDYGNPWPVHPYNNANNVNEIDGDADKDGEGKEVHSLDVPAVTRLQEAYIRKVVDTVNDLDNVLYEVTNETAKHSKEWQYHVIKYVKEYESKKPKQHPVGMTYFDSGPRGTMDALYGSPADWISPGDDGGRYDFQGDPPAADGRKVSIADTDHIYGTGGDSAWVWKTFTRGHNPIYMDPIEWDRSLRVSEMDIESARRAMGLTIRFAERMNLAAAKPASELASTKFCLAVPGRELLVYLPEGSGVTVDLSSAKGELEVEWSHPVDGRTVIAEPVAGGARRELKAPFSGPAVLHLRAVAPAEATSDKGRAARGPLRVHPENPRYFTDGTKMSDGRLKGVYLTGSHTWSNLMDRGAKDPPPVFDFDGYLKFLEDHNHNFIRLWRHEHSIPKDTLFPLPYRRTGPGNALDGKPKYDLNQLNPEFFDRMRRRVKAAGDRGIYVGVMLFKSDLKSYDWEGHPFNAANNVNGINGDPDGDGEGWETHTLKVPAVTRLQEAYVRKVVDTVNDLDNVLFEIANEAHVSSAEWQYHMIRLVKNHEAGKSKRHPVGMTSRGDEPDDEVLIGNPGEWYSPGSYNAYAEDLAAADGRKVSLLDTDHIFGVGGGGDWIWKAFARGHNPIYMDIIGSPPADIYPQSLKAIAEHGESARRAMGDTRRFAERMDLAAMKPRERSSSTKYCLANPGREYLVYQPGEGEFTVELAAGTYAVEWFDTVRAKTVIADRTTGEGRKTFKAPFTAPAVLYLKSVAPDTPAKAAAQGPLRVHPENPRYFSDGTGRAVYLTGSHTWNVMNDPDPAKLPAFDYEGFLDLLEGHHHNFFRLWARMGTGGGPPTPLPTIYARTGPGKARDGEPKYDLTRFNDDFFRRLRQRVKAAGDRGIYVAVMFFGGDNVENRGGNPNWPLHPYNNENNVNGIDGDPNGDDNGVECYRLQVADVTKLQEAYVRKVIDTVGDLDNVVWEVGNELPGTLEFANHMVRLVKEHERKRPKQHPVGISTFADAKPPMKDFGDTPADWVTPDTASGDYMGDPPAADGKKVIVSDTDHLWGVGGDAEWVWKSFTRGLHPIYMDPLRAGERVNVTEGQLEGARKAMGQTRRFAERMNLVAMTPSTKIASTRFCLADPKGMEFLVYLPDGGKVTVDLSAAAGEMSVEWFQTDGEKTVRGNTVEGGGKRELKAPFNGPAVLYLKSGSTKAAARGPLRVHPENGRYFTDGTNAANGKLKAVYLTGSHTWPNLIDRGPSDPPQAFDYDWYLGLLEKHGHNFIRLWGRQVTWYHDYGDDRVLHAGPLAWPRTGPGNALDGKPKFDLSRFDEAYFERLRSRVSAARDRGIYVGIMLFGGSYECKAGWRGNPFNSANNVNGIDGDVNRDGNGLETHTLHAPAEVRRIQEAYVVKVIDTVNDLDNVLFEISNESDGSSKAWQRHMIRFIHEYERSKPKQHPVGMTALMDNDNEALYASEAEWVSPSTTSPEGLRDLPPADGRKVSLLDSDHWFIFKILNDETFGRDWLWQAFCNGHNTLLMENLPLNSGSEVPVTTEDPGHVASRVAMGQTRRFAERINLAEMKPSPKLSSTNFCLADAGGEYLVYLPTGGAVTVDLSAAKGQMQVAWFDPVSEKTVVGEPATGGETRRFRAPFEGAAVLYLKAVEARN